MHHMMTAHHLRPLAVAWYSRKPKRDRQYARPHMRMLDTACRHSRNHTMGQVACVLCHSCTMGYVADRA